MPNWQPNWEDVQYQHAKAWKAVAACRRAASELDTVGATFVRARHTVQFDGWWEGNARDDFDAEAAEIPGEISDTSDALKRLAGQIIDASIEAANEQARREAGRERWRREWALELGVHPPRPGRGPG